MGFLERTIKRGISEGVGKAVGQAISKAVEPTVKEFADRTAQQLDSTSQNVNDTVYKSSGLEGAFANLERAAQDYATRMSENIKICPDCNKPTDAEKSFCPECGCKLPEETVAQGALCPNCNKQNTVGTKFCSDCGTKLPSAVQEEQAARERNDRVMTEWDEMMPQFPKWNCGGSGYNIERYEENSFSFCASFDSNYEAQRAVESYRKYLVQNGFHQAGQYPSIEHLYNRINGICYHVDTEHCFEGDSESAMIGFDTREPLGGYDYVKPEPKKPLSLKDLIKF